MASAQLPWEIDQAGDYGWVLSRTVAILSMQGGFALLEAGSVRPANRANIMMKNICDMTIGLAAWGVLGYTLAFDPSSSKFVGGTGMALMNEMDDDPTLYTHFLLQFAFAATTGTVVSGACAERIKFVSYVFASTIISSFIYPFVAYWAWSSNGWLASRGFFDFAGAGVVHMCGGAAALVSTCILGTRHGRFQNVPKWRGELAWQARRVLATVLSGCLPSRQYHFLAVRWDLDVAKNKMLRKMRRKKLGHAEFAARFQVSDPVSIIYGTFILTVGWLSFNMSSGLGLTGGRASHVGRIGVVTAFGGSFGGMAGMLYSALTKGGVFTIGDASVGVLAGLVSITACCAHVSAWEGSCIGLLGGLLACASTTLLEWAVIDDPVGAIPVHLVGGIWGLVAMGLFSRGTDYGGFGAKAGLFHGGGGSLLGAQMIGVMSIIAWTAATTLIVLGCIGAVAGLRVTQEQEEQGLDKSEHHIGVAIKKEVNSKPSSASPRGRRSSCSIVLNRNNTKRQLERQLKLEKKENEAAATIQAMWRGKRARRAAEASTLTETSRSKQEDGADVKLNGHCAKPAGIDMSAGGGLTLRIGSETWFIDSSVARCIRREGGGASIGDVASEVTRRRKRRSTQTATPSSISSSSSFSLARVGDQRDGSFHA